MALLRIIMEFIFSKLEIIFNGMESREKQVEAQRCMVMAQDFSKRKTYKQLMAGISKSLCENFGYQSVSLLFYDLKCKILELLTLSLEDTFFSFPPQVVTNVENTAVIKRTILRMATVPRSP